MQILPKYEPVLLPVVWGDMRLEVFARSITNAFVNMATRCSKQDDQGAAAVSVVLATGN